MIREIDFPEGVLVGVAPQRWIVAREEPGLGTLHLHRGLEATDRS